MRIIYLSRPIEGTRYTKSEPRLPLDICLKAFVELSDERVIGPFEGDKEASDWMWEKKKYWGRCHEMPFEEGLI